MSVDESPRVESAGARQAFPDVCKWFDREDAEAATQVQERSRRFLEAGVSPCQECPLCPSDHHSG